MTVHPPSRPATSPGAASHPTQPHPGSPHGVHHPHGAPPRRPPPRHRSPWLPLVLVAVVVGGGAAAWRFAAGPKGPAPQDLLIEQVHQAAAGMVTTPHAYGGALTVEKRERKINVTVEGLPPSACVQVGWQLAREGTVIVNGVLPQRISAAKLSELCNLDAKGATLVWAPEQAEADDRAQ